MFTHVLQGIDDATAHPKKIILSSLPDVRVYKRR